MTTKKSNKATGSVVSKTRKTPVAERAFQKQPSGHVLEQRRMLEDMSNGTFQPDFICDLPTPDRPNPFLEAIREAARSSDSTTS